MAYEINININGDVESPETTQGVSGTSGQGSEQEKAQKQLAKYVSAQTIEPFIAKVKQNVTQNIQIVTGNSDLQQRVNFAIETVQFGVNTYKHAKAGAIIGEKIGIGMTGGALLGLALTAVHTAMDIAFEQQRLNLQERMENYQLQQSRSRFGSAYNRSREGV
jgi:hypothetical protein